MKVQSQRWLIAASALIVSVPLLISPDGAVPASSGAAARAGNAVPPPAAAPHGYIVQATSDAAAAAAVAHAGGTVRASLPLIHAVAATLDEAQLEALRGARVAQLAVFPDATVTRSSAAGVLPETYYPSEVAAQQLQVGGITGTGVTVAVVDSGLWNQQGPDHSAPGVTASRVLAQYDVVAANASLVGSFSALAPASATPINDLYGHGTHVTSIIASSGVATTGNFQGVAPGVNLVSVRVLDANGVGTYSAVIEGIDWVIAHRALYNIRVMNLSLSAPPQSFYWQDPLNQAVMAAWQAGIVVVVAAGNRGSGPMTIGVPGNVPYVITVGAVTDSYHPLQVSQYKLTSFSSAGPTYEGFVKPEVVA